MGVGSCLWVGELLGGEGHRLCRGALFVGVGSRLGVGGAICGQGASFGAGVIVALKQGHHSWVWNVGSLWLPLRGVFMFVFVFVWSSLLGPGHSHCGHCCCYGHCRRCCCCCCCGHLGRPVAVVVVVVVEAMVTVVMCHIWINKHILHKQITGILLHSIPAHSAEHSGLNSGMPKFHRNDQAPE